MSSIQIIADIATSVGTLSLAWFTFRSVRQSKDMAAAAREGIELTKSIEKAKIKPYCVLSKGTLNLPPSDSLPDNYFYESVVGLAFTASIENHGPGIALDIHIAFGGNEGKLWTRRILAADILSPGERISFSHAFTETDFPESEVRDFPRAGTPGRIKCQATDLRSNVKYVVLEYKDVEEGAFRSIRLFVPRVAVTGQVFSLDERSDAEKLQPEMMGTIFMDGKHPDTPWYAETVDEKALRLGQISTSTPEVVPLSRQEDV